MQTEEMIPAHEFCMHHNIELSFIYALQQSGLVEIIHAEEKIFIPANQLNHLENWCVYIMKWILTWKGWKPLPTYCSA